MKSLFLGVILVASPAAAKMRAQTHIGSGGPMSIAPTLGDALRAAPLLDKLPLGIGLTAALVAPSAAPSGPEAGAGQVSALAHAGLAAAAGGADAQFDGQAPRSAEEGPAVLPRPQDSPRKAVRSLGIPLAVVSNKNEDALLREIAAAGLSHAAARGVGGAVDALAECKVKLG